MPATDLSVCIPSRNEKFLGRTVQSVLAAAEADTECIIVLDGYWPAVPDPIYDHPKVTIIHVDQPVGQRGGVNMAASLSRAKYVMKLDAHCSVDQGFDRKLIADCEPDMTVIPRMHNLHVFDWLCTKCNARYYQADPMESCPCGSREFIEDLVWKPREGRGKTTDFMCFDHELHFQYWYRYKNRPAAQGQVSDLMSSIGACFFMERKRFWDLEGLDEAHGFWGQFGTEIACKSWLSGGRHVVNKNTWFAHYFRVGKLKFPYHISGDAQERARLYSRDLWLNNKWPKQIRPLSWLVEKFAPVKYWHDPVGTAALANVLEAGKAFNGSR